MHDPSHYSCSELVLGIKFTSTSHADLGHNLPHDQGCNLGNPIYFPHLSITECRSSTPFFLPSGIYSTAGLSAYMAILSLRSVMGPGLRSTPHSIVERITAASTDSSFQRKSDPAGGRHSTSTDATAQAWRGHHRQNITALQQIHRSTPRSQLHGTAQGCARQQHATARARHQYRCCSTGLKQRCTQTQSATATPQHSHSNANHQHGA